MSKLAVVLVSGGLDSMVAAARAREDGFGLLALSIDYNQRHQLELAAARRIAATLGAERHIVLPLDLRAFGGSALTSEVDVPKTGVGPRHSGDLCAGAQYRFPQPCARLGRGERRARSLRRRQRARLFGLSRLPSGIHRRVRAAGQSRDQGGRRGRWLPCPRAAATSDQGRYRARGGAAGARRGDELVVL